MALFRTKQEKSVQALKERDIATALAYLRELLKQDQTFSKLADLTVLREAKLTTLKPHLSQEDVQEIIAIQKLEVDEEELAQRMSKILSQLEALLANPLDNKQAILALVKQYDELLQKEKSIHAQALARMEKEEQKLEREVTALKRRAGLLKEKAKLTEKEALAKEMETKAEALAEIREQKRLEQEKIGVEQAKERQQLPGLLNSIYGLFSRTFKGAGEATEGVGTGVGDAARGVGAGIGAAGKGIGKGAGEVGVATGQATRGAGTAVKETGGLIGALAKTIGTGIAALGKLFRKK